MTYTHSSWNKSGTLWSIHVMARVVPQCGWIQSKTDELLHKDLTETQQQWHGFTKADKPMVWPPCIVFHPFM